MKIYLFLFLLPLNLCIRYINMEKSWNMFLFDFITAILIQNICLTQETCFYSKKRLCQERSTACRLAVNLSIYST